MLAARRFKVPYIISEHWSRYFPESKGFKGILRRIAARYVVRRAAALVPVSHRLKEAMAAHGLKNEITRVIPNTVDIGRFRIVDRQGDPEIKTVVHVSCFDDTSKNISGFLDTIKAAASQRSDFRCVFIGEGPDLVKMKSYAESLELPPERVVFTGLLENEQLAGVMATADFSVLSSRYETFGTVVIESLACGVPVLATRTGIVPEIITPNCGVVVEPGDRNGLTLGFLEMMDRCRTFDKKALRDKVAGRYSDATVAAATMALYSEVLNPDRHD
jgi:glycosyltransferase involved in cell wall biosynthesis